MFKPIINNLKLEHELVFILIMLNNNINLLYEKIEFNEKIKINTSKKVRRNPNQHGQLYTNRKMDCIMLLNTLYYLTTIQNKLRKYKSSIYKKDGKTEFYIPTINERIEIKEKIKKKLVK
ncbi:MAG: hypothetical protein N2749_06605 [Clostridia bacterium]|nr:hypothetical protein [Clostridia bacterium]